MAKDIFAYHDSIIDYQTDTEREGEQGNQVDGQPKEGHEDEGTDQDHR